MVDGTEKAGKRYYVAIGDSLAANVGVDSAKDGYVSRFHNQLQIRDGADYGLQNFGIAGETSSTLLRGKQLSDAISFIKGHDVAYVTIDIGGNDLLGHLFSPDCSESVAAPACQARLGPALTAYQANLKEILAKVKAAAPKASIIFLGMYNPFSIGFGSAVGLEGETDAAVESANAAAAKLAADAGVKFADGQAQLKGRTGATTHMLEDPADIHPRAVGYDLLTVAMVGALG